MIYMIGIIGGVGFFGTEKFKDAAFENIDTPFGIVQMLVENDLALIPRHGIETKVPPHRINHRANIFALKEKGITKIIGVNSTGSLKKNIAPPTILIPHDYIGLWNAVTYHDDKIVHVVPGLNENLRQSLISQAKKYGLEAHEKGVYIQTTGPRLETKAEIIMLSNFGDVVGMTMASEATLAIELGLGYASICSVDNYAHGIIEASLTNEMILDNARTNGERIRKFLLETAGEL
ncbi:MAG: MTAP family purine nucleoside phosphorylase [Methanomassiliicoccales archaeon]|nr:MAG: MTAP family purine nucleoside phosphorylase [Methanomassiliicoccales archaeon]